jgi:hypothetical protein
MFAMYGNRIFQPGYLVRLKRRRRLLGSFLIPWYFGDQAEPLANAIREELAGRPDLPGN